jgi:hypothetical protein
MLRVNGPRVPPIRDKLLQRKPMATKSTRPVIHCTTCHRDVGAAFYAGSDGEMLCDECHGACVRRAEDLYFGHEGRPPQPAADVPIEDYTEADWEAIGGFIGPSYELRTVGTILNRARRAGRCSSRLAGMPRPVATAVVNGSAGLLGLSRITGMFGGSRLRLPLAVTRLSWRVLHARADSVELSLFMLRTPRARAASGSTGG